MHDNNLVKIITNTNYSKQSIFQELLVENGIFSGTYLVDRQAFEIMFSRLHWDFGKSEYSSYLKIFNNAIIRCDGDCTTHCLKYEYEILLKILILWDWFYFS